MTLDSSKKRIEEKMKAARVGNATIQTFLNAVDHAASGDTGLIEESAIEPIASLPTLEQVSRDAAADADDALMRQLAVIKLNGGLGTGMGLDKAKSLIAVKDGRNFLDFVASQILRLRKGGSAPAFYLMNSFTTRAESLEHLRQHAGLAKNGELDFLQNKVPKLEAESLAPVSWPAQPDLEWCPPGHGDIYPSLLSSGVLQRLLDGGIRFLFVSNSDNLGATVHRGLLRHMAASEVPFLMEVALRTSADRKGGHLTRRRSDGRLLLREVAQCASEDQAAFQDIERHRFFNTNNLWIRLDRLRDELDRHGGIFPLPIIRNYKTVDPRDPSSTKVLQLESAMGAAIESFDNSEAVVVPRDRFAPVKTTSDLLAIRSDAYIVTEEDRLELAPERRGQPPAIDLDSAHYKLLPRFETLFAKGPPSLLHCVSLKARGPIEFSPGVRCEGAVEFENSSPEPRSVKPGVYRDTAIRL